MPLLASRSISTTLIIIYTQYSIFNSGTLNTAEGIDIIMGIRSISDRRQKYVSDGFLNTYINSKSAIYNRGGTIDIGDGKDTIIGISEGDRAISITYDGTMNTGDGNDTITGTAFTYGIEIRFRSILYTGRGNDMITGTGILGIDNSFGSTLDTGRGDDIITGTGVIDPSNFFTFYGEDGTDLITNS